MVVRKVQTGTESTLKPMLIWRYPYDSTKQWIEQNEKEILELNFDLYKQNRNILLDNLRFD
jgi:hypothetical protein